jgi:hypothetical protein
VSRAAFLTRKYKLRCDPEPHWLLSCAQTDTVEGTPLNSFLRTEGIKGTFCVDCHGMNALPKFKYFHDKNICAKSVWIIKCGKTDTAIIVVKWLY